LRQKALFLRLGARADAGTDAGTDQQGVKPLAVELDGPIQAQVALAIAGEALVQNHVGVLLPEVGCQAGGQGSLQAAATAAAGPGQGQAGGSPEGLAAGHQQQSAPLIFAGGRIQGWPGPFGQIPLAQPQRGVVWQGVQQGPGQPQVDSLQFPHRRQGLVLH
jgi:hypothetical protein